MELRFSYPADFDCRAVSFLFQDASDSATGGGTLTPCAGALVPHQQNLFLTEFDRTLARSSSTLRELMGVMWCLQATRHLTKSKVIFLCDNWSACQAICRGSSVPCIQELAESIFLWCMEHGKICWPVWVPRNHLLIQEADRRSRLSIPHDDRSPSRQCWLGVVRTSNVGSVLCARAMVARDSVLRARATLARDSVLRARTMLAW